MNPINLNAHSDSENDGAEEYAMPCAEAILAGTLALMTGHARCGCAQHRNMMAQKAASNLQMLAQHPLMSEGFRTVAFKMHAQWLELIHADRHNPNQALHNPVQSAADATARTDLSRAELSRALWHTTPEVIQ